MSPSNCGSLDLTPAVAVAHLMCAAVLLVVGCDRPPEAEPAEATSLEALTGVDEEDSEGEGEEEADASRVTLRRPPLPLTFPPHPVPESEGLVASAFQYNAPVFERAGPGSSVLGIVRRGRVLPVGERVYGPGCAGRWYRLGRGFVCTSEGFLVGEDEVDRQQKHAVFNQPMPYDYAAVARRDGAPRFFRPPDPEEFTMIQALSPQADEVPEVLSKWMVGDYFVALDETVGEWVRTVRGRYVHTSELTTLTTPLLVGSELTEELQLPLALVFGEDRTLWRLTEEGAQEAGTAEKYARFHVEEIRTVGGVEYAVGAGGLAVPREEVRLARRSRPDEAIESNRWIHVDLAEQTLVVYDEGEPVYATMVASGREGYDTPRGVFQIEQKYVSTTMDGSDPVDGDFEVEEVPWTMYYWRSFALHGAYWHDDFGQVRSHGCTNLAPSDARWLFEWTSPEVPDGWHGYRNKRGTWVWLSNGDAEYDATEAPEDEPEDEPEAAEND